MRVLVTGAAGFIGSHVVESLQAAGHEVRGLDSLSPAVHNAALNNGRPDYLPASLQLRVADVRDASAVASALDGVDAVCHLAAMVGLGVSVADLPLYADVNVTGTAVLLAAMAQAGVQRLVLSSSMVVYGEGAYACPVDGPVRPLARSVADLDASAFEPRCPACGAHLTWSTIDESFALDPRNAYATSKLAQEHLAANWARLTGGVVAALRYHNVYGPRMPRNTPYSGVAAIFRSALENGVPPCVFEDGGQLRDFIHVRDVADCNVAALNALASSVPVAPLSAVAPVAVPVAPLAAPVPVAPLATSAISGTAVIPAGTLRAYNVASGTPHTVGEMARALATAFGGGLKPKVTGDYRLGDVRHIVATPQAAARDLGFRAQIGFEAGMAEFATAPLRAPASHS